jgi:hypothetical protein
MTKYILFKNGEIEGFLSDENTVKRAVSDLADSLVEEEKKNSVDKVRVFRENVDCGVRIYTQLTGVYFDGNVNLKHVITWRPIQEYKARS